MTSLQGKNILLAISGGIAAYKIPHLVRLLVKKQANVKVVMSQNAKQFVTPLTLSALSKNEVLEEFSSSDNRWNNHIELGLWADAMIVAPATACTLSKMASGQCDNLLLAVYLSARCPVFFAPTMDLDMYEHPSTQKNIKILQSYGNHLIDSEYGELASGLIGKGRMAEPETILETLEHFFFQKKVLQGKKILITAGPTYEAIDPVRFVGNYSSGKMGIALANVAYQMGAEVILVLGPAIKSAINQGIKVIDVVSAQEMYVAVHQHFESVDIAILAAAVADYTPKEKAPEKIKKKEENFSLELVKTKDILLSLGKIKKHQYLMGFALETHNEEQNAKDKILKKNLDAIVLNSLNDSGAGFSTDTNKITIISKELETFPMPLKTKNQVAYDILDFIINHCK